MAMLQKQNTNLSSELAVQRGETRNLEAQISKLQEQRAEYEHTLLMVNRLWDQLNADIVYLTARADDFQQSCGAAPERQPRQSPAEDLADPYLARLIAGATTVTTKKVAERTSALAEEANDVEKALSERSRGTSAALAALLARQDVQRAERDELAARLAGDSKSALQEEVVTVQADRARLRAEADAQRALVRTTEAQLRVAEDDLLKDEEAIKNLSNELADKAEEVTAAQRKLQAMRQDSAGALRSQASLGLPTVKPEAPPAPPPEANGSLLEHEEDLKLTQRELKAEQERSASLRQCVCFLTALLGLPSPANSCCVKKQA